MQKRFCPHAHTEYSNIRLLDSTNKPKELIDRAIEIGLSGIAITDHECLSSSIKVNKYAQEIKKECPDFKVAIGNEIYLTQTRDKNQKYYHFILIAKNKTGHRALRELSSRAWMNSYFDRGMERVPTLYSDLEEIVNKYPSSLIATTACIGGELSQTTLALTEAEKMGDSNGAEDAHNHIIDFVSWCLDLFGDDFYIECAPACSKDQIAVNKRLVSIAKAFNIKMVIGDDAHYLRKEDRYVHKAYLNSKGGEREVDEFYEYTYLQDEEQIKEHIRQSIPEELDTMIANSQEIYDKIEEYSLLHNQTIPKVEVKDYPKSYPSNMEDYPVLNSLFSSDDKIERYWINECWKSLEEKKGNPFDNLDYVARLEEEADTKKIIGEKLGTNMFAYPVTLQHYIDLFWDCGSTVGAGRGSSCSGLNHYLLGITQLDPVEWNLPWFRYLNKERVELGDIDTDLCPSKRPAIVKKIKEERGQNFNSDIDELSRQNLGCTMIATFGTETSRSAVLTSCRGYRNPDYPDGIDVDTAQYLSSLIPSERGFVWPLEDVVYGNPDKGRKPIQAFIKEVELYDGLLDIMLGIQGLINKRSSHASGFILFDEDPYEFSCFMRTPKGEIITQYDLHDTEASGSTKYDFLVTEVQDKIAKTIELLQKDGQIDSSLSLREVYNKYLHPAVIPTDDERCWQALWNNSVLNVFQFDSDVGSQAVKKIKPHNITELADANGLLRLMTQEKGAESPMDKYIRYKSDINLWYKEMKRYGLKEDEMKTLEPYFLKSYGVPPSQEQLMQMLMDENICGFSLSEANDARKIVGKKQMSRIPELKERVLSQAVNAQLGKYVWECGVQPQIGYSFSVIHALAYSFVALQTLYLAVNWNPIYWNTACLIVNSGSLEVEEDQVEKTTDYAKIAKALGEIISRGIKISLVDINRSGYSFEPDIENNQILFGMKALSGINTSSINTIIENRPFKGIKDFMIRCPLNKTQMISLIKSGAFDEIETQWAAELGVEPRILVMVYYLSQISNPKDKLNLQNFNGLMQKDLIPQSLETQKEVFVFNKKVRSQKKGNYFYLTDADREFYEDCDYPLELLNIIDGVTYIIQNTWDKLYQRTMDVARDWLKDNQEQVLKEYNQLLFLEQWDKYAKGNISSWEMDSLCFYYHEHELKNVNTYKYGISNFFSLPEKPEVDYFFRRNNKKIPIYKLTRIAGTVINKNDIKSSISLLTTTGVVNVKFTKEYYAMFNRQISEIQDDGSKKIMEKGWMTRGTKLLVTGFRRDDQFVAKKYSNTVGHTLYKITDITEKGDITLIHERYGQ